MDGNDRTQWLEDAMVRWERSLLRICYAYLSDLALAEDAVQETFLKAWKSFDQFRGASAEKTWLMRIAINTCKDIRRSAWFRRTDRSVTPDQLPEGAEPFTPRDDTIFKAIAALKPKLKEAVLLCWYQQLSAVEAAEVLKVSRASIYKRLDRARKQLQKELEEWYNED